MSFFPHQSAELQYSDETCQFHKVLTTSTLVGYGLWLCFVHHKYKLKRYHDRWIWNDLVYDHYDMHNMHISPTPGLYGSSTFLSINFFPLLFNIYFYNNIKTVISAYTRSGELWKIPRLKTMMTHLWILWLIPIYFVYNNYIYNSIIIAIYYIRPSVLHE